MVSFLILDASRMDDFLWEKEKKRSWMLYDYDYHTIQKFSLRRRWPSCLSDFKPWPRELQTPTESRHTTCLLEGKSPSVKLKCRRENKQLAKTNLKNMDITMQKLQHIGSVKDLRPKNW